MAPNLITSYPVYNNANSSTTLTTPSFTPSNGEVVVIKLGTWDTGVSMGAPTGGSQTYTSRQIVAPGGFNQWCGLYTAVISGSPGSMTISSVPSASSWHSMVVERWSSAQLAASPAINTVTGGSSSAPNGTVTTVAANSVVSWVCGDVLSRDTTGRVYRSSATEDGLQDGHLSTDGVTYYAYQTAAAAGAQAIGLTTPNNCTWVMAGIEVQAAASSAAPPPQPAARRYQHLLVR